MEHLILKGYIGPFAGELTGKSNKDSSIVIRERGK